MLNKQHRHTTEEKRKQHLGQKVHAQRKYKRNYLFGGHYNTSQYENVNFGIVLNKE